MTDPVEDPPVPDALASDLSAAQPQVGETSPGEAARPEHPVSELAVPDSAEARPTEREVAAPAISPDPQPKSATCIPSLMRMRRMTS